MAVGKLEGMAGRPGGRAVGICGKPDGMAGRPDGRPGRDVGMVGRPAGRPDGSAVGNVHTVPPSAPTTGTLATGRAGPGPPWGAGPLSVGTGPGTGVAGATFGAVGAIAVGGAALGAGSPPELVAVEPFDLLGLHALVTRGDAAAARRTRTPADVLRIGASVSHNALVGLEVLLVGAVIVALGALSARLNGTDIATTWARGHAALAAGRNAEAEACFRTTLQIVERQFGPEHWRTAVHLDGLAQALVAQRRLDEAAPLVARAMAIAGRWSTMPRALFATILLGAAALDGARDRPEQAAALVERARGVARGDPTVLAAVERTVARLESGAGHDAEAADALARIPLEQLEASDTRALVRSGLARLREGDAARAVQCLASAHAVAERESAGGFAEAFYRGLLGEALARAGRDDEALVELDQAIIDYDSVIGEHHPASAALLVELAAVRMRLGDAAGARVACERVLATPRPPDVRPEDPYRDGATTGDPVERERDRARALLARVRSTGR